MPATLTWKACTGTDAATEATTTNWNLLNRDAVDSGSDYTESRIAIPATGSNYSYERILRLIFTGAFNLIDNVKLWKEGTLSDGNLIINAGETDTGTTPVNTASAVASSAIPTTEGTAIDITPSNPIDSSGEKSDYLYIQLEVPSTVTTLGAINAQVLYVSWTES